MAMAASSIHVVSGFESGGGGGGGDDDEEKIAKPKDTRSKAEKLQDVSRPLMRAGR